MASSELIYERSERVDFLYTNIGRGHPFYLDGIVECLPPDRVGTVADVFAGTTGIARAGWRLARLVYESAGGGGPYSALYNRVRGRSNYSHRGPLWGTMGRPLRKAYLDCPNPLVVAHPVLVAMLRERSVLVYQHGEVTAPRESWVKGQHRVLVPLSSTADTFVAAGLPERSLFVSGLCIEPTLVDQAKDAREARLERLVGSGPLCGAFYTSGAEPREHVERLAIAALSAVTDGGRAIVFARRSGRFAARAAVRFAEAERELETVRSLDELPAADPQGLLCLYDDRRQLTQLTARLFGRFDYFVAPSHERTNWALGLGLPMFIVDPPLGSYSPLNRELLLASSVARTVGDRREATRFGETVGGLHTTGELERMAEAGWGRFEARGFFNIAEFLQSL